MRTNKTNTIGLILPNIVNPFFPDIVKGIDDYCKKSNYGVIIVNKEENYKDKLIPFEILLERKIDGMLIIPFGTEKDKKNLNDIIITKKIPIVLIDRYISNINCTYVSSNNFKAAYDATNYLIKNGHKKIGVISQPRTISIFLDRIKGYKQALKDNSIVFKENLITEYEESIENGYFALKDLFSHYDNITAILAMCDYMAYGVYKYCQKNKINIPNDLSVISIDDIFASSLLTPPLTTMTQQKYKMGYIAAKILLNDIINNVTSNQKITLDAKLTKRASCKKIC
jgi:DNA-binding LacI/PurR family transcriptional regulator